MARPKKTLAEMLMYLSDPLKRKELEEFRIEYEKEYGPTDLTKRYTSTWPAKDQDWLIDHHAKAYFDGLPPFCKAYLKGKMQIAAREGNLDSMPDGFIELYVRNQLKLDDGRGR